MELTRRALGGALVGATGVAYLGRRLSPGTTYPAPPETPTAFSAVEFAEDYERAYFREHAPNAFVTFGGRAVLELPSGYLVRVSGGGSEPLDGGGHGDIFVRNLYYVGERRVVPRIPIQWERDGGELGDPDVLIVAIAPHGPRYVHGARRERPRNDVDVVVETPAPPSDYRSVLKRTVAVTWDTGVGRNGAFSQDVEEFEVRASLPTSSRYEPVTEEFDEWSGDRYRRVLICLEPGGQVVIGLES